MGERPGRVRCALCLLAVLLGGAAMPESGDAVAARADFLLKFARLVEWPAGAQPVPEEPLVVGVAGDEAAAQAISQALAGRMLDENPVVVRRVASAGDVAGCHIVFLTSERDEASILAAAREHAALTVGESDGFAARGGVINFYEEDEALRFEINSAAADRAGFAISSRLLRLAKLVGEP